MDVETLARIPPWDWPADADQVLLRALGDPSEDEAVRQEAAMLAGDLVVMSDEVAAGLLAVLDSPDEDEKLRGRAAIAFGPALEELDLQMDDDPEEPAVSEDVAARIRTALQRLHLDSEVPKHVRRMALEASIRGSEDWHPEAVREAYHSGDPDWERTAVFCMGYMPGFEDRIVEALESPRDDVRRQAITAAGNQGVREAWPHVLDIL